MKVLLAYSLLLLQIHFSNAILGVDLSSGVSVSGMTCFIKNGVNDVIARAYRSSGKTDPTAITTIQSAYSAGMSNVSVYLFPCPQCQSAAYQVDELVDMLEENQANTIDIIWIDVESPDIWYNDQNTNNQFVLNAIEEIYLRGYRAGIYSSKSQWTEIMGSFSGVSSYPLWYAHYDGNANFQDFKSFGGWTKPFMKQYTENAQLCGSTVDKNYYVSTNL